MKYDATAAAVLDGVGGESNVSSVVHCATRLRFKLVDRDKADKAAVEATPGVITVVESGGQFQVVIGNDVPTVYAELGKISSLTGERAQTAEAGPKGNILNRAIDLISSIFSPILWALAGTGLLKALLALVVTLGWLDATTQSYTILYSASDALIHFLPVLLAVTSAKRFGANQFVSMAIAGALVYPDIMALNTGDPVSFFGLPVVMVSYVSSVIPIIVAVWVQSHLERWLHQVLPSTVRNFLSPMLVVLVLVPLTLLTIGPATTYAGQGISHGIEALWSLSPAVGGALMGGLWQVFVIFGLHWAFVPIITNDLGVQGYSLLTGPLFAAVLAQAAAALGVFIRTRNAELRQIAGPSTVSGFLAGVTEPAIYGVTLRLKKPFVYGVIAGAVGGGIAAAGGSAAEGFVLPGLITITSTINIGSFTMQLIGTGVAVVLALVLTLTLGFKDLPASAPAAVPAEDVAKNDTPSDDAATATGSAAAAGGGTATLTRTAVVEVGAPLEGRVIALAEVPDQVFSSGALGEGVGLVPTSGEIHAPVAGELVSVMPHAFGIRTADGVELLVHVGIDTVQLKGQHFTTAATQGSTVAQGELLGTVDLDGVRAAGYDPTTVVLVTNSSDVPSVVVADPGAVQRGATVLTVVQ
ncbi:beta-glucoside-specific PTS transporter subunit IIABC [Actinotalea sp. C106]|uniref:beta-glucoside-specific PTS transporter subunit IIABC n=1 Tax=Actinotalea sp. C106 TaxID=2908644 RepID=UPI0020292DB0|nr:beta-glucoside-specific PTS transporter subunit IIABC [Actinotalea sp. C106]